MDTRTLQTQTALLRILVGSGEKAIEAFHAADNPLDEEFVADLERVVERSGNELALLMEQERAFDGHSSD